MPRKKKSEFPETGSGAGYTKDLKPVVFRVTKEQDQELEDDVKKLKIGRNEAARRRCFPASS